MARVRKICVVTGTRAEYGLLYWVLKEIEADPDLELQLVVTGMHLSPEFGLTSQEIEKDGFEILEKVEMLLSSDTATGVAKSVGLATISFADVFDRLKPDLLMVLGDRFELLAAAQVALFSKLPIAHISGGDVTEGAFDDAIRHSITKMAHLHFVTNEESATRVRQLGETPESVFNVGNPGLDHLARTPLMSVDELSKSLDFRFRKKNILVTFHPVTLDTLDSKEAFKELLIALNSLDDNYGIIFTASNADNAGRALISLTREFVETRSNAMLCTSLGQQRYLSMLAVVDIVMGNSSSGLTEVPSFKKPTINIGDRQKGRPKASSIIDVAPVSNEIVGAIDAALNMDCSDAINPYGDGQSAKRIVDAIRAQTDIRGLIKKSFRDV